MAGEGDLLLVGDVLITKDEHGVFVHARLDRAVIYASDLSEKHRMQRADRNRHDGSLPDERLFSSLEL